MVIGANALADAKARRIASTHHTVDEGVPGAPVLEAK